MKQFWLHICMKGVIQAVQLLGFFFIRNTNTIMIFLLLLLFYIHRECSLNTAALLSDAFSNLDWRCWWQEPVDYRAISRETVLQPDDPELKLSFQHLLVCTTICSPTRWIPASKRVLCVWPAQKVIFSYMFLKKNIFTALQFKRCAASPSVKQSWNGSGEATEGRIMVS